MKTYLIQIVIAFSASNLYCQNNSITEFHLPYQKEVRIHDAVKSNQKDTIEFIYFSRHPKNSFGASDILKFKSLKYLIIDHGTIDNLNFLCNLSNLEVLIFHSFVDDIQCLSSNLDIHHIGIGLNENIKSVSFSQFSKLESLVLTIRAEHHIKQVLNGRNPRLKFLSLNIEDTISFDIIQYVSRFDSLLTLDLFADNSIEITNAIKNHKDLVSFGISTQFLNQRAIDCIGELKNLDNLHVSTSINYTNESKPIDFSSLNHLKSLFISISKHESLNNLKLFKAHIESQLPHTEIVFFDEKTMRNINWRS
jgi:hypothetical protein